MSSAVSVCSFGSGGAITSDAEMSAWLDTVSPPDSVTVLGHELQRDSAFAGRGLLAAYVAVVGTQHVLVAHLYADEWRVSLLRCSSEHPSATGRASTIEDATARMLVAAQQEQRLGIEVVLQLRMIGGVR